MKQTPITPSRGKVILVALVSAVGPFLATHDAAAQALFSDTFEVDSSALWNVRDGSANGVPDFTAQFAFDYSTNRYVANGVTNFIPSAPNSTGGTTRGVKLTVNKDDVAATAAVSLYPAGLSFSNNYALRADMWINYNGPAFGGTGSTEFGTFGINHVGDKVNWSDATFNGDGVWFAVTGEGGASRDYRAYIGDNQTPNVELLTTDGGFLDRDGNGTVEFEVNTSAADANNPLKLLFPVPPFETPGVPGKQWVQVEVRQRTNDTGTPVVTWLINGYVIAEHGQGAIFSQTAGTIMLGTMDPFSSIASPKEDNFVIFDNVRVVNLDLEPVRPVVSIISSDTTAAEPGADTASFTITRTGDTTGPLTVQLRISGTASNGVDYATLPTSITLPAGVASTNITVTPLNDPIGEANESIIVTLAGSQQYEVREAAFVRIDLADDGDVAVVNLRPADTNVYERIVGDTGTVAIERSGDVSTALNVNLTVSGTASNGVDFQLITSPVTIPAGETNVNVVVTPIDDANAEGDETVVLALNVGSNYALGTATNATVLLRDDDFGAETILFSDNFDTDSSNSWRLIFGQASATAPPDDYIVQFAYDYSQESVPPAPHTTNGTTRGLKVRTNKDATGSAAAVNLYPIAQTFSGDFALRFDVLISVGSDVAGTTEHTIAGINHSGTATNRNGAAGSDGLWFAIEGDGSNNRIFASYASTNSATAPTVLALAPADFASFFTSPPWGYANSPSVATNAVQASGSEKLWADVEISQVGNRFALKVNNTVIFDRVNTFGFTSGTVMIGHNDQFNSIGSLDTYSLFDNVRVVRLGTAPPQAPNIIGIRIAGTNVEIEFTGGFDDTPDLFTLQSSATVDGTYADESAASIVQISPNAFFRATVPQNGAIRFYRIQR